MFDDVEELALLEQRAREAEALAQGAPEVREDLEEKGAMAMMDNFFTIFRENYPLKKGKKVRGSKERAASFFAGIPMLGSMSTFSNV